MVVVRQIVEPALRGLLSCGWRIVISPMIPARLFKTADVSGVEQNHLDIGGCDYREFRPHPCGTLIADLVDELATVLTIALDLEDWESLCRTIDEHFQVRGVCVTNQSGVGSARVWPAGSKRSGVSAPGRQTSMLLACSGYAARRWYGW
jgi:hypothetical protein